MSRVVVIGAGAMGLGAAFRAARNGHEVIVLEGSDEPGGMAGQFDLDGLSLERFYHFICKTDQPTFDVLEELGLTSALRWRPTSMGLFTGGALHRWGDPVALAKFPFLSAWEKLRYAFFAWVCVRRNRWPSIEDETAREWIVRWCGQRVYDRMWKTLFDFKFYEHAENISAAWIWTRIRRIGRSRRSLFQEELGYLEGGSMTLVNALLKDLEAHGGSVGLGTAALRICTQRQRVTGVETSDGFIKADQIICTAPTPFIASLVPDLPTEWKARYSAIRNIGCICVIFKLARSVSPHFWVNVSEPGIEIPGVIEFSNLRELDGDAVVYVPYYMPVTHPKFQWKDAELIDEAFACLRRINPDLGANDLRAARVARLRYGQPVCEPGFAAKIPPTRTPIAGLQIADTSFYYPEDRGIAESLRLGQQMAENLEPGEAMAEGEGATASLHDERKNASMIPDAEMSSTAYSNSR